MPCWKAAVKREKEAMGIKKASETTSGSNWRRVNLLWADDTDTATISWLFVFCATTNNRTLMLDMPKCLPRLRRSARCKQGPRHAQTGRKHVCHVLQMMPKPHCLVAPNVVAVQLLGRRRTKPWMLEFASDVALDDKDTFCVCICWRLRQLEPTVGR
jgi:hypothetical protein